MNKKVVWCEKPDHGDDRDGAYMSYKGQCMVCRVIELEGKLDSKKKREADLTRAWELKLHEYAAQVDTLASCLDAASKLCEVYFNIAVEAGVSEADIRRKRDERFKPNVVEKPVILGVDMASRPDRPVEMQVCTHCGSPVPCGCWPRD